jgi:hypothetical protein
MSGVPTFDDEARAELLCYLVVSQLVAHARTGAWLQPDHMVESTRIWLKANAAECDWLDRIGLARLSVNLAPIFLVFPDLCDASELAKLFTDGWLLDRRSPVVRAIFVACRNELQAT